jgi:lipid-binding SYLF domain-containing protein
MKFSKVMQIAALAVVCTVPVAAQSPEEMEERLDESAEVVQELLKAPDSDIPEGLLDDAECLAIIPSVKKVALGFGGQYGRGAVVCRGSEGGPWGAPSMIALDGGSFGLQIGGSAMDVVMFFMTPDGIEHLLKDQFTLGGEASVAAGPKGRTAGATDLAFQAEVLSYSRSQGLFAGVSLEGASLRPDHDANEAVYGREIDARTILVEGGVPVPAPATQLLRVLQGAD